jgi:hypothetical protein
VANNVANRDLVRRLKAANVIPADESPAGSERGIIIEQHHEPLANVLSETKVGISRFIIDISMTSTLKNPFSMRDYAIELPWECHVEWLPDPAAANCRTYRLPDHSWEYPREDVLNHRRLVLRPGQTVVGILLGTSLARIPAGYRSGIIPMKLIVTDYLDRSFSNEILMLLDRTERLLARQPSRRPVSRPAISVPGEELVSTMQSKTPESRKQGGSLV